MTQLTPKEIVRNALEKDELDLLLLARRGINTSTDGQGHPYNTDLVELLNALYVFYAERQREKIKDRLLGAIKKIVSSYEGLIPVAQCILLETVDRSDNRFTLGLPLEEIAAELRQSIRVFSFRLERDKTGAGAEWPDGRLGDLRRLSNNTRKRGGPSFCE